MAEAYGGLVGAYGYALRSSRSWLLRTYVVASAAVALYLAVLLALAVVTWAAAPIAFGERAFLGVIGILLVVPLVAPVLVAARRHRRGGGDAGADRWLGLAGYGFVASVVLALYVTDPSTHAVAGPLGPVAAWLDALPDGVGLAAPVAATAGMVAVARLTRPAVE